MGTKLDIEQIAKQLGAEHLAEQAQASPMQVAALLLEQAVQTVVSQGPAGQTNG